MNFETISSIFKRAAEKFGLPLPTAPEQQAKKPPRGINLSYSKISTYLQCPLKYEFQHVKRQPTRAGAALTFGSVIHEVLQRLHENVEQEPVSEGKALRLLDQLWRPAGYSSFEEEQAHKARGQALLKRYVTESASRPGAAIESLEKFVEGEVAGCRITGRLDRYDRTADGKYICIDYKTGERPPDAASLQTDLQANLYYMIGDQTFGKKFEAFEYWYLEAGQRVLVTMDDLARRETERVVRNVAEGISAKRFHARKGILCGWCDFRDRCPAWPAGTTSLYRAARESQEKMALSYSRLSLFENCAFAYKKTYIDRAPMRPKWFFSVGQSVHKALEEFYTQAKDGPVSNVTGMSDVRPQDDSSLENLLESLSENWIARGFDSEDHEREMFGEAKKWLKKYHSKYVAGGKFRRTDLAEEYFELPIGRSGHVVAGYMDRLEKNDDGTYSLYDYKTDPKMREQKEVDEDLQLTLYAWACKQMGIPLRDLTLVFVQFNDHVTTVRTEADFAGLVERVEQKAGEMADLDRKIKTLPMAAAEALFPPKVNKYCGGCDFLPVCPIRDDILTKHRHLLMHQVDAAEVAEKLGERAKARDEASDEKE